MDKASSYECRTHPGSGLAVSVIESRFWSDCVCVYQGGRGQLWALGAARCESCWAFSRLTGNGVQSDLSSPQRLRFPVIMDLLILVLSRMCLSELF